MFVNFFIIKNKEYLTGENSCFVILTSYLNEPRSRHCKFPNERLFSSLSRGGEGGSFKPERSLNFSAVMRGADSNGSLI